MAAVGSGDEVGLVPPPTACRPMPLLLWVERPVPLSLLVSTPSAPLVPVARTAGTVATVLLKFPGPGGTGAKGCNGMGANACSKAATLAINTSRVVSFGVI